MAKSSIENFNDVATIDLFTPRPIHTCSWSPPPPGVFKINVDGASSDLEGNSSIRIIIRDCKDQTIATFCKPLQAHYSAELVEVLAMEQGTLLAQELQLPRVMFEGDALTVIKCHQRLCPHSGTLSSISFMSKHPLNFALSGNSIRLSIMQPMSLLNLPVGMDLFICGKGLSLPFLNHLYKQICCTNPAWQVLLLYLFLCCNAI
ncbi:hypothetical protein SO802_028837 [Lithocarpus litseifolius]|uniref:RNase H type-1 domain-containing protein n=1 Tax=Lithocarpus litseifolius TaxID=425828 RepID=A0AAW2BSD1_9ROSI